MHIARRPHMHAYIGDHAGKHMRPGQGIGNTRDQGST